MSEQNSTNQMNVDRVNANNTSIRILLDFYMNMYSHTIRRIDSLYDILDEIRSAINILGGLNERANRQNTNTNYANTNYANTNYANTSYANRNNINQNFRYYSPSANENRNRSRDHYNGERSNRGGRNGRGANNWNRHNLSGRERTHSWGNYENTNTRDYFDWLNNRIYIQGRPYRIEFERYNFPSTTTRNPTVNNDMLNFIQNFYSNVPVVATPAQIQSATRTIPFSEISNPLNNSCPITLEPFSSDADVTEILGCKHLFNPEGLTSWFQNNVRCPICRYDIRTNRISARQGQQEEETKEETVLEETKEEDPIPQTQESTTERNSNQRRRSPRQRDASDNILESTLTEITETLITQLFNGSSRGNPPTRLFFNNTFDASNNEIIFRGFRM